MSEIDKQIGRHLFFLFFTQDFDDKAWCSFTRAALDMTDIRRKTKQSPSGGSRKKGEEIKIKQVKRRVRTKFTIENSSMQLNM